MRSLFKQVELRSAERDGIQSIVNKSASHPLAPWGECLLLQAFAIHLIPFSSWLLFRLHGLLCTIKQARQEFTVCHKQDPHSTQSPCLEMSVCLEVLLACAMSPAVHLLSKGAVTLSQRVLSAPGCRSQDQTGRQPLFLWSNFNLLAKCTSHRKWKQTSSGIYHSNQLLKRNWCLSKPI